MSAIPDPPEGYSRVFGGTWEQDDLYYSPSREEWRPRRHARVGSPIAIDQTIARRIKATPTTEEWGTW